MAKPVEDPKELIKLKNVLGLELSIKDLLFGSKNLPFVLMTNIPNGIAETLVEKLGHLGEKIELKSVKWVMIKKLDYFLKAKVDMFNILYLKWL